jgi:prefoldin subunit 5
MPPKQQADTLRQLVGLDFTDMDAERKAFFVDRTIVNAKVKQLESQKAGIPIHPGVPSKEISVEDLIAESNRRKKVNDDNAQARRNLEELKRSLDQLQQSIAACSTTESSLADGLKSDLATIEKNRKERIAQVNAECDRNVEVCKQRSSDALSRTQMEKKRFGDGLAECKNQYAAVSIATGKLVDLNVDEITDQIASAGTTNRRIRDHHQREELSKQAKAAEKESEALTAKIEAIDAKKSELLYSAPFPVQGLAFTDSGVTYNEIPFSQASSAEQLRVSVAMGLAMNPKLRVMLIRDGSLLDDEGMKMLAKFAEENNAQIWIERVADKGGVGVVIEDGQIEASLATVATPKE